MAVHKFRQSAFRKEVYSGSADTPARTPRLKGSSMPSMRFSIRELARSSIKIRSASQNWTCWQTISPISPQSPHLSFLTKRLHRPWAIQSHIGGTMKYVCLGYDDERKWEARRKVGARPS